MKSPTYIHLICIILVAICLQQCSYPSLSMASSEYEAYLKLRNKSTTQKLEEVKKRITAFKERYKKFDREFREFQEAVLKELKAQEKLEEQPKFLPNSQTKPKAELLSQPKRAQSSIPVQLIKPQEQLAVSQKPKPNEPKRKPIVPLNPLPVGITSMASNSFFLPITIMMYTY